MNRILLADNQVIFRAGAARVLSLESDMRLLLQCEDVSRLVQGIESVGGTVVIFASSLGAEPGPVLEKIKAQASKSILIRENGEEVPQSVAAQLDGLVSRSVTGPELVECIRRIARGQRCVNQDGSAENEAKNTVAARVRERLTPKEFQIVGLIVEGCKNKEIAERLGTKEQVIKNYLRSIYDKTGVSDRLELALFTIHHRLLADVA